MKILVQNDGLGSQAIAFGFALLGEQVVLWDPSRLAAFEAFGRLKPDIYVGPSSGLTPAILRSRGNAILALWKDGEEIEKPDRCFIYSEIEIPWPYIDCETEKNSLLAADVLLLGDYDASFNSFLSPLFEQKYVSRAYGPSPWPIPYYAGTLDEPEIDSAIASSKVVVLWGGRSNSRWVMRAVRSGALPILVGAKIEGCPCLNYENPESFISGVGEYVSDDEQRGKVVASIQEWALSKKPYEVAQAIIKASFLC
jgi:hypothetical protein